MGVVTGPTTESGSTEPERGDRVSRGYEARRKAKRQHARVGAEKPKRRGRSTKSWRLVALIPIAIIAAIFAAVAFLGLGSNSGISRTQVREEVTALLAAIPQNSTTLGSPRAPLTLWVFADVQCPTVRRFVTEYLPSIVDTWVRTGALKLEYRSLQTDTISEPTFFEQETAALAAGRQNRLWNYVLTFVYEQEQEFTGYATDEFLSDIASQLPDLKQARWHRDRQDPLLSKQVALSVHAGRAGGVGSTPSFWLGPTSGQVDGRFDRATVRKQVEASLQRDLTLLREEATQDVPTLRDFDPSLGGT